MNHAPAPRLRLAAPAALALLLLAAPTRAQVTCAPIGFDAGSPSKIAGSGGLEITVYHVSDEYLACGVRFSSSGNPAGIQTSIPPFGGTPDNRLVGTRGTPGALIPDATRPITLVNELGGMPWESSQVVLEIDTVGGLAAAIAYDVNGSQLVGVNTTGGISTLISPVPGVGIHRVEVIPNTGVSVFVDDVSFGPCPPLLGLNGCPASSGNQVTLTKDGECPSSSGQLDLFLDGGQPLTPCALFFHTTLLTPIQGVSLGPGCRFLLPLASFFVVPLDAAGAAHLPIPIAGVPAGLTVFLQGLAVDPVLAIGFSSTRTLQVDF